MSFIIGFSSKGTCASHTNTLHTNLLINIRESEDTMLLILKEIYGSMGIQTDAQLPQQTMSIERVSPSPSLNLSALLPSGSNVGTSSSVMGVDPTVPISNKTVGPPPKAGFVRKS